MKLRHQRDASFKDLKYTYLNKHLCGKNIPFQIMVVIIDEQNRLTTLI